MPFSNVHQEVVLRRLATQNPGHNMYVWRLVQIKAEKIAKTLVVNVYVDESSANYLQKEDCVVVLNFKQVKLRLHGKEEEKDRAEPMEVGPKETAIEDAGTNNDGTTVHHHHSQRRQYVPEHPRSG